MEKQFPSPPPQEWYDSRPDPVHWGSIAGGLKGARVLDFGCATGWLGVKAMQLGALDVVGVDIFTTWCHPKLKVIKFDGVALPFSSDYFDYVLTANTLHHLQDLTAGVSELRRVLRKHGDFVTFQEPCIPNGADERAYLKAHCGNEIEAGICERRPSLRKYSRAFQTPEEWSVASFFDSTQSIWEFKGIVKLVNRFGDYNGGVGIHAIKS